jgi:(1->4)-alpha-D-glucan 1-alpha-D-glucosylmutase
MEALRRSVPDGVRLCLVAPSDEPDDDKPTANISCDVRPNDDRSSGLALSVQGCRRGVDRAQELFCELAQTICTELRIRAEGGDADAGRWLEQIVALGEELGVGVTLHDRGAAAHLAEAVLQDALACRRIPSSTYRLQFNHNFTFRDARDLVPYLHALGISDCYVSPVLQARAGSSHGYDICDHSRLSLDLGGTEGFEDFAAALQEHGIGLILDAVPNHMGIGDSGNDWWMDVLENGPSSRYAPFFDIDWHPVNVALENKVLLPLLEDQYGRVLEDGKIRLAYEEGGFSLWYYQHRLPVAPCTYPAILEQAHSDLTLALSEGHEHLRELRSVLTALRYLPPRTASSQTKVAERHREKEVIKCRLAALTAAGAEVAAAIEAAVRSFNGIPGQPRSYDLLDGLIERQSYRLAYWRVAAEEINYRRFFDINELAAIRMDLPEVFRSTHRVLFRLLAEGKATGLRIDHPDGLRDPAAYFRQLQEGYLLARAEIAPGTSSTGPEGVWGCPQGLEQKLAARLASEAGAGVRPLYVVAEKILSEGETIPPDWAVDGTTGYDFLNAVNGLFIDADGRDELDRIYRSFTGTATAYDSLVSSAKKMTMLVSMASEINALAHQLDSIAEHNRRCRDFTLNSLTFALREVIACLPVYRTYLTGPNGVVEQDRQVVEKAVAEAKRRNPRTAAAIFDFVADAVLLRRAQDFPEEDRPRLVDWALKFQQLTGPVMAKSVEDTVFYTYNRLVSLNEVGGSPDQYGISVAAFHDRNAERLKRWPHSLLATSTHDTKRSEDVRARLNALSEMLEEWQAALARWGCINAPQKVVIEGQAAPDSNDEYLLYQTLLGAWPDEPPDRDALVQFRNRIAQYMLKAIKEAKVHTSWINPNEEYDTAVKRFVEQLLPESGHSAFLSDLVTLQRRVAFFGRFNSLSQLVLKLTSPGVPDFYQGCELWDYSLVDPDNRRPIDYHRRHEILAELRTRIGSARKGSVQGLADLANELVEGAQDGKIKAYVIYQGLNFRRAAKDQFGQGEYLALEAAGPHRDHVCAFARCSGDDIMLVVVPRLVVQLTGGVEQPPLGFDIWENTALLLPPQLSGRDYRNVFTGETVVPGQVHSPGTQSTSVATRGFFLGDSMGRFPVALLHSH